MQEQISQIEQEGLKELSEITELSLLDAWEIKYLGRKSELNALLKGLKDLTPEEKRVVGPLANATKASLTQAHSALREELSEKNRDWESERIDVTAPGTHTPTGHLHPITHLEHEVEDIFSSMGFGIADGPEAEKEWYNFDALNFPKDHPARDIQDTFWVSTKKGKDRFVMRTHTSPGQVRYMETHKPPFRVVVPGR